MDRQVLCGANYYEQKFYLNPAYEVLPQQIKDELKIMCVLFVQEVSGIIILEFNDRGDLNIVVTAKDSDMYFDEIGSEVKITGQEQFTKGTIKIDGQEKQLAKVPEDRVTAFTHVSADGKLPYH